MIWSIVVTVLWLAVGACGFWFAWRVFRGWRRDRRGSA